MSKAKPIPRQRFTLAHELGHIFLKHSKRDLYDAEEVREIGEVLADQSIPPKEKEADAFASELLVPHDKLKKYEADIKNIDKLAVIFHVSNYAMTIAVMNYWMLLVSSFFVRKKLLIITEGPVVDILMLTYNGRNLWEMGSRSR